MADAWLAKCMQGWAADAFVHAQVFQAQARIEKLEQTKQVLLDEEPAEGLTGDGRAAFLQARTQACTICFAKPSASTLCSSSQIVVTCCPAWHNRPGLSSCATESSVPHAEAFGGTSAMDLHRQQNA